MTQALNVHLNNHPTANMKSKKVPPLMLEEAIKEENKRMDLCKQKKIKNLMNEGKASTFDEAREKIQEQDDQQSQLDEQLDDAPDDIPADNLCKVLTALSTFSL